MSAVPAIADRISDLDWAGVAEQIDDHGYAVLPSLLAPGDCRALAGRYTDEEIFRSRIVMAAHGFGRGEYRYFAYPLPEPVARLRAGLYPHLAEIANAWSRDLDEGKTYPNSLDEFLERSTGRVRPDPPRCCCATGPATSTTCTRTCTGSTSFHSRSPSSSPCRAPTSPAASSC